MYDDKGGVSVSIYVTGDTHGSEKHGIHSVDGFMHRLNTDSFPEQKEMTKDDFVVICGDFGGVWNTNPIVFAESPQEKYALDWLENKPFTTLFVPGNHENYDRLTGCKNEKLLNSWVYERMNKTEKEKLKTGYPQAEWHGGKVRVIRPSVLMLERGYVFDIAGKACFAFGGAKSHDISDGILRPYEYLSDKKFSEEHKRKSGMMIRVEGVSWWKEEMPSEEEKERGLANLKKYQNEHGEVNFIFTHDAPASDKIYLGYQEMDDLNIYLQRVYDEAPHAVWFFGHMHDNKRIMGNHYMLYEQIVRIA